MRCFLVVSVLMAALSARAQGTPSPEAPAPAATPPEVPSQGPPSPLPEATPPLVPAPAPELVFPPLISHPQARRCGSGRGSGCGSRPCPPRPGHPDAGHGNPREVVGAPSFAGRLRDPGA